MHPGNLGCHLPLLDPAALLGPQRELYDRINARWSRGQTPLTSRAGLRTES
jgi:hypothetical protein